MTVKYYVTVPNKKEEIVDADWLTVNEKSMTFDLFRHGPGVGPVASVGIGPGVMVRRESES